MAEPAATLDRDEARNVAAGNAVLAAAAAAELSRCGYAPGYGVRALVEPATAGRTLCGKGSRA